MRISWKLSLCTMAALALSIGCNENPTTPSHSHETPMRADNSAQVKETMAVAMIHPSQAATTRPALGQVTGTVVFTATVDGVKVVADIRGLTPNSEHGFHIHEKGDLSAPDLSSAGGHFNPDQHHHGGPDSAAAHAGDLGNITADAQGNAHLEMVLSNVTLDHGPRGIIGRSVIVHEKTDDLKTDPAGNAGARIAGGIIQLQGT